MPPRGRRGSAELSTVNAGLMTVRVVPIGTIWRVTAGSLVAVIRRASWSAMTRALPTGMSKAASSMTKCRRAAGWGRAAVWLLLVSGQEAADPGNGGVEVVGAREGQDAEVVGTGPAEPGSLHDLDLLAQQQVEYELLVVVDLVNGRVQAREGDRKSTRLNSGDAGDLVEPLPGMVALVVQPAAGQDQVGDALPAAERRLDGVLAGDVGAQPRSGQGDQSLDVVLRVLPGAGDKQPAGSEPGHPVRLGQPVEGEAEHIGGEGSRAVG